MKFEKQYKITFTHESITEIYGFDLPLEEWGAFCKAFNDYFPLEAKNTVEWLLSEWDEMKQEYK